MNKLQELRNPVMMNPVMKELFAKALSIVNKFIANETSAEGQRKWKEKYSPVYRTIFEETSKIMEIPKTKNQKKTNRIKRPRSIYSFFCSSERAVIKNDESVLPTNQVLKELGKRWTVLKTLTDNARYKRFAQMAADDKTRYVNEVREAGEGSEETTKQTNKGQSIYFFWQKKHRDILKSSGLTGANLRKKLKEQYADFKHNWHPGNDEYRELMKLVGESNTLASIVVPNTVTVTLGEQHLASDISMCSTDKTTKTGGVVRACTLEKKKIIDNAK